MNKITLDHPDSQSADLVAQHIEQLSQLFPEVIKEGKVDFEALQDLLGNYIDTPEERFQLNWAGKAQARREAQKRSTGTLRPCPEESVAWDTTENLYIEGDNLEVLKLLQRGYNRKIKMIYIDPPYNTGNDFVYKDNYTDNLSHYLELTGQDRTLETNPESEGRYHSNWLNMMYPRLKLARNLLSDDGLIYISIDDNEIANLKKIGDEIFGSDNHLCDVIRKTKSTTNDAKSGVNIQHEYCVVYTKNISKVVLKGDEKSFDNYSNPDNDPLGDWTASDPTATDDGRKTKNISKIVNPFTGRFDTPGIGRRWRFNEEGFKRLVNEGKIVFKNNYKENERGFILKRYKNELRDNRKLVDTLFIDNCFLNQGATKELYGIFDGKFFDFPKPVSFLKKIIQFSTANEDVILDFFSGSSTTAHAVMQLNSEDEGNRKYIMVQLPEATPEDSEARKAGYKTIAEIGKERIRRAGKKIVEELKVKKSKEGALFAEEQKILDIGFKVFKLDSSNINTWDSSPSNLEGALYNSVQNIKSDRTEHDLLYEILLKYGIDLVLPINEHVLAGKTIYEMGAGALIVCMADHVKPETAEAIVQLWKEVKPTAIDESSKAAINCRVVFKDNGFDDNNDKSNVLQILKQHGFDEDNIVTI